MLKNLAMVLGLVVGLSAIACTRPCSRARATSG
jgi:hypothetical protein